MEVTCQLRTQQLSKKKGTAAIQLTFCWESQRLRLSAGEVCRPADWNAKTGRVKDKPGTYAEAINAVLGRWTQAGQEVHQEARRNWQRLSKQEMEAAIRTRYQHLLAEAQGIPVAELPVPVRRQPSLLEHMDAWCTFMESVVSEKTGRRFSQGYLRQGRHVRDELARFSEQKHYPLTFQSMNAEFYAQFLTYQVETLGNGTNTFAGYIKRLKNFLYWCESRELPTTAKFHDWKARETYVGADFLTAAELRRWAEVELRTPAVTELLQQHFPLHARTTGGRRNLTLQDHQQRLEHARDKFLLCAYTGLRISDAERLAPEHIHGDLLKIEAGKTGILCYIPFLDDEVLKPVELVRRYAGQGLATCLPTTYDLDSYLPHLAQLAGITRLHVTSRIGRKTFVTTRIYQGVPRSQVMLATGHQTEKSFLRYLGTNEQELVASYRRTARLTT
ncbi:phage integrase SAM-like domain-containing protein [Hymenobacter yonginensis]|uniref:Phage integrase SAM-like domain-containing protein n=1 Tax=Hymenobacter yonginensis TaxID=748197 RepID=A0ABY7PTQ0_9BACT|nr:phage integrase SAM-like domain-containing protein [Hymenobacter yonginensis]WBO86286.1 phage integrase SAM-like domain-containing protein [Hymenobacter yonginensis]